MLTRLFLFSIFSLSFVLAYAEKVESRHDFPEDKLPDFRFAIEPYRIGEISAVSGILQVGLRDFRINGTYAVAVMQKHLFKISAEYLRQKLGFDYSSGHIHTWVDQYAVGGAGRIEWDCSFLEHLDVGVTYSHSPSKNLDRKLSKGENFIVRRRIAGADAFSVEAESSKRVYRGAVSGQLFYDYVRFDQKFHSKKCISGPGAGLSVYHPFIGTTVLHLAAELRRPYLFLQARVDSKVRVASKIFKAGAFIESTKGFASIPSSTLFGFEFFFEFGEQKSARSAAQDCVGITPLEQFAASPAVFKPQVLAVAEEKKYIFCEGVVLTQDSLQVTIPVGEVSLDFSPYFSGTGPIVFIGTGLPEGFNLDPLTGVLTGMNTGVEGGVIEGEVTGINNCNSVVLPVTFTISAI